MHQESRISERDSVGRHGIDLDNVLVQQALDLLLKDDARKIFPETAKLPPELDAKCISEIPRELCRCVMLIPDDDSLFSCPSIKANWKQLD